MHFEILYHFLTVAQQGSISAAARKLHIAQPALSKQMQQLEEALGCTLLIRGSRRIRLTEAGKALCSRRLAQSSGPRMLHYSRCEAGLSQPFGAWRAIIM